MMVVDELTNLDKNNLNDPDKLFELAQGLGFGELHIKFDEATGLQAIIAIHNTQLGPAFGGVRCRAYDSVGEAIVDVMRLARGMTYKAAVSGVPHGGGKSVLIRPREIKDRNAYFRAFGKFINELGGRYIAAVDSGTSVEDMDAIATQTPYVATTSTATGYHGDPSPYTSLGIRLGIEAAVKFKLHRTDLKQLRVAIQGTGAVGYYLAKELHALGATLTVCDINPVSAKRCQEEFNAKMVQPDAIYAVECDVFAPCAFGGSINDETISLLHAPIVAGGANNQLFQHHHGEALRARGILYAPDYVINAGGLIYAAARYAQQSEESANQKIADIYDNLMQIFERAQKENKATNIVAQAIAKERLR